MSAPRHTPVSATGPDFLATVTHEVRTPLNAVIGMTELLRQMALPPEAASLVETIHMSGEHLLALVDDLLDTSRLEAGRLVFEDVAFVLRDLVEEAIEMAAATSGAKGLSVAGIVDPELPDVVRGDPRRLRQVLTNLLGNAVKFTASGKVSARLTRVAGPTDRVVCRFEVEDSGIGIAPEVVPRLFEPFVQADEATGRRYGGTGLGLSIAAGIVDAMGSHIDVDSTPGVGSRFHFEIALAPGHPSRGLALPACEGATVVAATRDALLGEALRTQVARLRAHLVIVDAVDGIGGVAHHAPVAVLVDARLAEADRCREVAERLQIPAVALVPPGKTVTPGWGLHLRAPVRLSALASVLTTLRPDDPRASRAATPLLAVGRRVLIVEDNDANQHLMTRVLASAGVSADVVTTGEQACAAVARWTYDLVLMDCRLPGMNGVATTRAIRAMGGDQTMPIVGVSASAVPGVRQACLDAGMNDLLVKPTRPSALLDALHRWLAPRPVPLEAREASSSPVDAERALWLDPTVVSELVRLDLFEDMLRRVTQEAPPRVTRLHEALSAADAPQVAAVAHGLVTLLGNIGWAEASELASQLELACLEADFGRARQLGASLSNLVLAGLPQCSTLAMSLSEEAGPCAR